MRYIGNKTKLLPFIEEVVKKECGDISEMIFCDLFAGTGAVGKHFKTMCKKIICNDLEHYSFALMRNYIGNNEKFEYQSLIDELNALEPVEGKIYKHFSPEGNYGRMFFTPHNAGKIDAIRLKINEWVRYGQITQDQMYFLIASLIESADKYSNTTGVYGAYLKKFNNRSEQKLVLEAHDFEVGAAAEVYMEDANKLISKITGDILYLDPPYNSRQYGSNYHILNYIARYREIAIKKNSKGEESKTGLGNYNKSLYSQKANVAKALESLIENSAKFEYTFMSYNNEGLLSHEEIREIFEKHGTYKVEEKQHKRYKSNNATKKNFVTEYIHILIR
tara:strand:- start:144 stop:1145 length:1002 start_codon:yes stop_codon:yes gene_type:complete